MRSSYFAFYNSTPLSIHISCQPEATSGNIYTPVIRVVQIEVIPQLLNAAPTVRNSCNKNLLFF